MLSADAEDAQLRIYCGEGARWFGRPLHEAIVHLAKEEGLAGATVLRGILGFGPAGAGRLLRLSEDLPVVIELVDDAAKLEAFLPKLRPMAERLTTTLQPVRRLKL